MSGMFSYLGRLTTAHPWKICVAWLVLGVVLSLLAPAWDSTTQDDDINFLPARCASVRGYRLLCQAFPQDVFASQAVFTVERQGGPLTSADFALVDDCVAALARLRDREPGLQIGSIRFYRDPLMGGRLTSADRQCTLIQVALGTPFLALQTRSTMDRAEACLKRRLQEAGQNAPTLLATGPAGVGRDLTRASASSLDGTTLATVVLVVFVLLVVYRAPLLALVPLATIAVSVWVALKLLALLTLLPGIHLVNVSKVFAIVILYGAGTDYCLFLISRYREGLEAGHRPAGALHGSVAGVGWALAASAGTVICGLGMMGFAEFAKVRCAGPAIALSLAVALLGSLTLAPALLRLLGRTVFWPRGMPVRSDQRPEGVWNRLSRVVVAWPLLIWSAAVLALLPLVVVGLRVQPAYKATGELQPSAASVRGLATINRHFTAGETGPITVLLASPTPWDSAAGRARLDRLSRGFAHLDNVAEVRSLTQPLGTPLPDVPPPPAARAAGLLDAVFSSVRSNVSEGLERARQAAREHYLATVPAEAGHPYVARLDVVLRSDPFDAASRDTLELIEKWLEKGFPDTSGVESACYGVTVNARDLAEVTEADRIRVNVLVLGGIFVILLALIRNPWLAAYLLATVLLSYFATLGATALAATAWSGRPLGQVDWRVPFFLFIILVAVGEDYNILLVTRALQERQRRGVRDGMRRALARTGGTITSCGLIMAGTFATLMLAGLNTLVQIGFALALGVVIDTFVVRPFLVPAFLLLFWRQDRPRAVVRSPETQAPLRRAG
jgi:RND superfamily putative drug exporter